MSYVVIAYVTVGVLIAMTGVIVKLKGELRLDWTWIALGGLAWPWFLFVAFVDRL